MAQKWGVSTFWLIAIMYITSCIDITHARLQCRYSHSKDQCTYILQNNVTEIFQHKAEIRSEVQIFLAGDPVVDPTVETIPSDLNNVYYHVSFTANPDLHMKQLVCIERLENGQFRNFTANIVVMFEPVIHGNCMYSQQNRQYLINFTVKSNPQLTLAEYGDMHFSVNDTDYDVVYSPDSPEVTNNTFSVQYRVTTTHNGNIIAAVLQASNAIGSSSASAVCPVQKKKEPTYDNVSAEPDRRSSSSMRLSSHKLSVLFLLVLFVTRSLNT